MKRVFSFIILGAFLSINSFGQKMIGFGAEVSPVGAKINVRSWFSKETGFEIFGGMSAQLDDFNPNDPEAGFKFLRSVQYSRTQRTYFGLMGKMKWVDVFEPNRSTNLPIGGILVGREWYDKRIKRKAFAVELGYQYGSKEYNIYSPLEHLYIGREKFDEFPLILNFRYSFMQKR